MGETGQVLEQWDGRGSHWHNEYDEQRRPIALHEYAVGAGLRTIECLTYADNSAEFAERNQCGSLIRHDDSAGTVWFRQVALNGGLVCQTRRFLPDQAAVSANWPANEVERDLLLQPGAGYTAESRYGPTGEVLGQIDAGGHLQQFNFDRAGQLQRIVLTLKGQASQPLLSAADYNAAGQLLIQVAGNNVTSVASYQPENGRLECLTATTSTRRRLQEMHYEYDPVGNILRLMDHTQADSYFDNQRVAAENAYTYDSLYQLTSAKGRETAGAGQTPLLPELNIPSPIDPTRLLNYTELYDYDLGGNQTLLRHESDKHPFSRRMYIDPQSNRALPWNEGEDVPDFSRHFDANGNLQFLASGAQPLSWDARNQLHSVINVQRSTGINDGEWYRYSAAGERVAKFSTRQARTVNHQEVVHYLPGLEVRTADEREELQVIHVQLARGSVRCLHWVKGLPDGIDNDQVRYSIDDHLGSSCLELDQKADVISHEGYYAYGGTAWWAARSKVDADYKTIRYSGKERDDSGLYYYGYRYYAPWLGRWINPDPAGSVDSLNLYCMVRSNPVGFKDWMGLVSDSEDTKPATFGYKNEHNSDRRNNALRRARMTQLFGDPSPSRPSSSRSSRESLSDLSTSPRFHPFLNPRASQTTGRRGSLSTSQLSALKIDEPPTSSSSSLPPFGSSLSGGQQTRLRREAFPGEKSELTTPVHPSNIHFHYTNKVGYAAILRGWSLTPSSKELDGTPIKKNTRRHYFTDLAPETQPQQATSESIFGIRRHGNFRDKTTHYFEINTEALQLTEAATNNHIFYVQTVFDIPLRYVSSSGQQLNRIIRHGETSARWNRTAP